MAGNISGASDLASARQIAKLLTDGVRLSEIARGVSAIRRWLPEVGLSKVRLRPGPGKTLEVEQPGGRTDKRGQFLFAVGLVQSWRLVGRPGSNRCGNRMPTQSASGGA